MELTREDFTDELFGRFLREALEKQDVMAKDIVVGLRTNRGEAAHFSIMSKIMAGVRTTSILQFVDIAYGLGVSPVQLMQEFIDFVARETKAAVNHQ